MAKLKSTVPALSAEFLARLADVKRSARSGFIPRPTAAALASATDSGVRTCVLDATEDTLPELADNFPYTVTQPAPVADSRPPIETCEVRWAIPGHSLLSLLLHRRVDGGSCGQWMIGDGAGRGPWLAGGKFFATLAAALVAAELPAAA